jgi:pimeloyl-ACP methyl ester carboxylesterase
MTYFTLNMHLFGQQPSAKLLGAVKEGSSTSLSDMSSATSPDRKPLPPAARSCAGSAPVLLAAPAAATGLAVPPCTPEVSAISDCSMSTTGSKTKSSPFQREGINWADREQLEEHITASISVASAVHLPEPAVQANITVRGSSGGLKRRMGPPRAALHQQVLTSRLSAHTSMLLRSTLSPLEEALSEDLANNNMPVLFLHGVGGLPAYLEMLLQVRLICLQLHRSLEVLFVVMCSLPHCCCLQVMALGHPVIVVQCPGVSMRLGSVLSADQVVEQVVGILDKLGVEQACVIGHSYGKQPCGAALLGLVPRSTCGRFNLHVGRSLLRLSHTSATLLDCVCHCIFLYAGTFIAGRLARLHRERVRSLCLIDPVCFGMFMPQLLCNFLYTAPPWRGLHQ